MHPSLITLCSARDDPSGGRCPAQIPQLDTPQASKESHNSIHNPDRQRKRDRQTERQRDKVTNKQYNNNNNLHLF